ncbi:hypothetical protein D3C71_2104200 [compost metagenome]
MQTRAGAVAIDAVFALANRKDFLQQRQGFTHGVPVRERTEILPFRMFRPAMHGQTRMGVAAEENEWV